ncbi:hypothetical protein MPSEU_000309900 [Mayamaea pseudoterrestris]|nr:hypothetical protein MPSEU_000309900 [Mayamaea pseudoterrestris]
MSLPTIAQASSRSTSPSSSDRIATRDLQEYNSVDDDDDDDGDGSSSHEAVYVDARRKRRTRKHYSMRRPSFCNTCCFTIYVISMLLTLLVGLSVVYIFRDSIMTRLDPKSSLSTTTVIHSTSAAASSSIVTTTTTNAKRSYTIYYDPFVGVATDWNPYNDPPQPPQIVTAAQQQPDEKRGYMQQPSLYNNSLVFLSEGDLYMTTLPSSSSSMPAMRLTTTIGNVQSPKLFKDKIAFSATYTGRRDVYLMHLSNVATKRLTYTSTTGIRNVAQLNDDSILFAAPSQKVSLPDVRLYRQHFSNNSISEVPLAQAIDGIALDENCLVFVRFKQSSRTARYVGGTAENLWMYCNNEELAVLLTADYNGTSKAPSVGNYGGQAYLLFLSDRSPVDGSDIEWRATSMTLWAMPLPTKASVYGDKTASLPRPVQITHVSCQYNGMALQEYAVDPVTNNVVLRVGADLHLLTSKQMERRIQNKVSTVHAQKLAIQIYSDFHELQERQIMVDPTMHLTAGDVFDTAHGSKSFLATLRGQTWVLPVVDKVSDKMYQGSGQNLPPRRYQVVPGAMTGGMMRVLTSRNVPLLLEDGPRRLSVVLATDPLSPTAEHAFYLVETQADGANVFGDLKHLPEPFLGGKQRGGSTRDGGLGSVKAESVTVSPCGRRMAWADTDGRILVMSLPLYIPNATYTELNSENELGEPMDGSLATFTWSPGGRYLAVEHQARNQFSVITIVDCGETHKAEDDARINDIVVGRHVQATPNRFNSYKMFWGKSSLDYYLKDKLELVSMLTGSPPPDDVATTLYFLTDRDVTTDVGSPWGSRAPMPHFMTRRSLWALPLLPEAVDGEILESVRGRFAGGGGLELFVDDSSIALKKVMEEIDEAAEAMAVSGDETRRTARLLREGTGDLARHLRSRKLQTHEAGSLTRFLRRVAKSLSSKASSISGENVTLPSLDVALDSKFPKDMAISFGVAGSQSGINFARAAYRMTQVPKGKYISIVSQTRDDGTLVLVEADNGISLQLFSPSAFPSDDIDQTPIYAPLDNFGISTCRNYVWIVFMNSKTKIIENTISGWSGLLGDVAELSINIADTSQMGLSVLPPVEHQHMFNDAWRMLRDYFYDYKMHSTDWLAIHERYSGLVGRCTKREEVDDVLAQMASELSALHVFVYGGEYNSPIDENDQDSQVMVTPGSLGASMVRDPHWKGYRIVEIPFQDPDFNLVDDYAVYSPLSDQTLRMTGQDGLKAGDVIVAINGESVMPVPDIHKLLRGTIGRSVRLEVLRLESGKLSNSSSTEMPTTSLITSPISPTDASNLFYNAWEWRTRETAKSMAAKAGFTVAYIHMRSMLADDENAFARGFFGDYDAQALILDVRHNNGGNIDSWILTMLQRRAWMYWQGRTGMRRGDADWDAQFAFRGHIVVLIDELTASDGEGVSRGISELGLGRLIGTRTWGGGIWLQSDNILVDGGIATAPEIGTFNNNFGWGLGIEQHGVVPDIVVDNNPRTAFDGVDTQLSAAIQELKRWLKEEPVVIPNPPKTSMDMSVQEENCPA